MHLGRGPVEKRMFALFFLWLLIVSLKIRLSEMGMAASQRPSGLAGKQLVVIFSWSGPVIFAAW
jgi:hypothetical protein